MSSFSRLTYAGVAVAAALAASAAFADTMSFKADLKGAEEVPPVNTPGNGSVNITYDTASKRLSWRGNQSGLTGNPTAAHFHGPAEPGKNAGVMIPAPVTASTFEGSANLTDEQARALMAGQLYFNIHTAANPNGEVRGQVTKAQ